MAATRVRTTESAILATGEFGYPVGHIGHLTEAQASALDDFKKLCAEKGLYKPASAGALGTHDDTTLLYIDYLFVCRIGSGLTFPKPLPPSTKVRCPRRL